MICGSLSLSIQSLVGKNMCDTTPKSGSHQPELLNAAFIVLCFGCFKQQGDVQVQSLQWQRLERRL